MTITPDSKRYRERLRAANIVKAYMIELQGRLDAKPDARNADQVKFLIYRLSDICSQIMGNMSAVKPRGTGDFSAEEIEEAQRLIAAANNPFEE